MSPFLTFHHVMCLIGWILINTCCLISWWVKGLLTPPSCLHRPFNVAITRQNLASGGRDFLMWKGGRQLSRGHLKRHNGQSEQACILPFDLRDRGRACWLQPLATPGGGGSGLAGQTLERKPFTKDVSRRHSNGGARSIEGRIWSCCKSNKIPLRTPSWK